MPGELRDIECDPCKDPVFENPSAYLLSRTAAKPPPPLREIPKYEIQIFRSRCKTTPAEIPCPRCLNDVTTEIKTEVGAYTWLTCSILLAIGCALGCCIIPFFIKRMKNYRHICPICHKTIHIYKRL